MNKMSDESDSESQDSLISIYKYKEEFDIQQQIESNDYWKKLGACMYKNQNYNVIKLPLISDKNNQIEKKSSFQLLYDSLQQLEQKAIQKNIKISSQKTDQTKYFFKKHKPIKVRYPKRMEGKYKLDQQARQNIVQTNEKVDLDKFRKTQVSWFKKLLNNIEETEKSQEDFYQKIGSSKWKNRINLDLKKQVIKKIDLIEGVSRNRSNEAIRKCSIKQKNLFQNIDRSF